MATTFSINAQQLLSPFPRTRRAFAWPCNTPGAGNWGISLRCSINAGASTQEAVVPDSPGTRGLSLSAEPRADGWQRPLAAPPPCCCTVGSFQAVWKTKQVSFAKGHRPKHRAVLAACFFSHRLPLSLNRKILDKGLGRHLSPRCHCWPRTVRGAGSASSARQAGLQHGDGARNKRENKVKPKKKKKETRSSQDERNDRYKRTQEKPQQAAR